MYKLRGIVKEDLDRVLEWRNNPEIRKNMYNSDFISKEDHYAYFEKIWNDPTKKYFICEDNDGNSVGVVNYVEINENNKTAFWAFYSADLNRRGAGSWMEYLALNYAFESLNLNKLNCEVLDFNYKIVEFHLKFGFRIEGCFHRHHKSGDRFADVYRLSIFREDWLEYQKPIFENILNGIPCMDKVKVGKTYEEIFMFTQDDICSFSELSGDINPVHLDAVVARTMGFQGTICHGMLVSSALSRILGTKFPGKGTIFLSSKLDFLQPVYPNVQIKACLKVVRKVGRNITLETVVLDAVKNILIRGEAEVLVPKKD